MLDINSLKDIYAIQTTSCSCVGICKDKMPVSYGNYFNILCSDGKTREVANMWYENFNHILTEQKLSDENDFFEVGIKVLDDKWALIHDIRFPHNYYLEDLCYRVPMKYWSYSALLKRQRDIDSGKLIVGEGGDRIIITDSPKIKLQGWTVTEEIGITVFNDLTLEDQEKERTERICKDIERQKLIKQVLSYYDEDGYKWPDNEEEFIEYEERKMINRIKAEENYTAISKDTIVNIIE